MKYDVERISNKIKIKIVTKKIIKSIIYVVLTLLFIINLILLYQTIFQREEQKVFGDIYIFNIVSESMLPTLKKQDIVVVKACKKEQLSIGDIITFYNDEEIISHRIVKINNDGGKQTFITKGDNNNVIDNFEVKAEDVIGKVCFKIAGIGKIVVFIQNEKGFFSSIALITIIFIMINMSEKKKNIRKIKRKKYEIKKLRDNYNLERK